MDRVTNGHAHGHDEIPGAVTMLNGTGPDDWHPEVRLDRWPDPATGSEADTGRHESSAVSEPIPPQDPPSPADHVARLRDAIAAAAKRAESARFRAASREAAARDALRGELMATRQQIVEMDERHHDEMASIRAAAQAEVQRIIDDAHRVAAELGEERAHEC